ncbi:MAG: CBS domain-containing protein [Thaumarchaeota archaeon]|nr:CBS domain-containing protein [Nitrososphaerota archaeon]MDE1872155.1 CBS domain-containing protein [Nitrososphaerota archaeon]
MLPRLESIKQARQKIGLTQQKLASLTGVSTSMINQIESGRCQPSYATARKIFEVLWSLESQSAMKAGDICSKEIVKLKTSDTLNDAIKKMQDLSISQVPVFEGTEVMGVVTEDGIVKHLIDNDETQRKKIRLSEIMDPRPPIVDYNTPVKTLVSLIRYSKCVLVSKNTKIVGIITASDTLKIVE